MNPLLKALLKESMDLYKVGKAAVSKQYGALFSAIVGAGEDVPAIVANWGDLKPELEALLSNPAADADLLEYAVGLLGGEVSSPKAQAVIAASADLLLSTVSKVVALMKAIDMPSAPAVAAEPAASEPAKSGS